MIGLILTLGPVLLFRIFKMCLPLPRATAEILPGHMVHLTIPLSTNAIARHFWGKWTPGAHVQITFPNIAPFQPHPFTIASKPSDGSIELYIRAREGVTQRLYEKTAASLISGQNPSFKVRFDGIYGASFPDFAKFDVVLLVASGIGITFTIAILKDIIQKVKGMLQEDRTGRCKRIGFIWVVRHQGFPLNFQR